MPAKKNYLKSILQCKCPRCREGNIFKNSNPYQLKETLKMNEHCPVCLQPTEIEVGFYYGTGYVSYALTVAFSVSTFIAWWVLLGFSLYDNSIFYWLGLNAIALILAQPLLMRWSRVIWLSWFVKYDQNWKDHQPEKNERIIPEQMNNW